MFMVNTMPLGMVQSQPFPYHRRAEKPVHLERAPVLLRQNTYGGRNGLPPIASA
jgi:hypothetical protein